MVAKLFDFICKNFEYYFILMFCGIPAVIGYRFALKKRIHHFLIRNISEILLNITLVCIVSILLKHQLSNVSLKYLLGFCFGLICPFLSHFLINSAIKGLNTNVISDNKYGLIILLYLLVEMCFGISTGLDGWSSCWYATDYSMGIGSRFFIGSLLKLFYRDYLPAESVYTICVVICLITVVLSAIMLNALIRSTPENSRNALFFLVVLFLASPGSISGMWITLGRLENYGMLIGIICLVLFECINNIYIKYGLITILSCISIAIYQGNLFMYYPLILVPIIYNIFENDENTSHINTVLGVCSAAATGSTFLFFQFFSSTTFASAGEMAAALAERTDLPIAERALDFELFRPITYVYGLVNVEFLNYEELPRERAFITFIIIVPLILLIMALFVKIDRYYSGKRYQHAYFYYSLLLLTILPQYMLNVDWGRWMIATGILVFFEIFYLVYKSDPGAISALQSLDKFTSNHRLIAYLCLIYMAGLGKFHGRSFITQVNVITDWLTESEILKPLM